VVAEASYGYSIEPVPAEKRHYSFWDNFAIWFGAGVSIAEFWAGALLVPYLSLPAALAAIIIGHAIGNLLLSIIAWMGVESGVPTMVLSRGSLGRRGSYLPSILNYLQLIGWTAVMLVVGAEAMQAVTSSFIHADLYLLWIVVLGFLVTVWSLIGPEKWRGLEKVSAALLLVLTAWLTYVTISRFGFWRLWSMPGKGGMSWWVGLDLVVAMPVSWAPLVADYARFSRSSGGGFWGTYVGYFISSGLFYFIGALTNMAVGKPDPISIIASYGLGIPAMLIIVFSTTTTTFLDVYSAAITFKNIKPDADARKQIILVGVLGTLLAMVFPVEQYEWFLLLIGGAFVSLTAIMVADFLARRWLYRDGWRVIRVGVDVDWASIVIWGVGFAFYMLLAAVSLLGLRIPVVDWIADNFGSTIPTLILVTALYVAKLAAERGRG